MQLFVNRSFISLAFLLGLSTASHVLDGIEGSGESANVTLPKGLHTPFLEVHLPALVHLSSQSKGPAILAVSGTSGTTGAPVAQSQSGSSATAEDASTEASIAAKYKIAGCDRYGVTYCSTNCVQCDSSGRVQKKPNCANFQYCQECYDYCYCVTA